MPDRAAFTKAVLGTRRVYTAGNECLMVTIAHPDKVEMYLVNTDETCKSLAANLHNLAQMWQDRFALYRWEDRPKILDEQGIWRAWEFVGRGSAVDITVRGPAYHIEETSRRTRLFNEPGWVARPFTETQKGKHALWPYLGWIRIASKDKREPEDYADILFSIGRDLEKLKIEDFPRELEIAVDTANPARAKLLRQTVRLKRPDDTDLVHFRIGLQGRPFPGPSRDGDREYANFRTYEKRGRQLVVYPKQEIGVHRIELRLKLKALRAFHNSYTFLKARGALVPCDPWAYIKGTLRARPLASPTLQIFSTLETLLKAHITWERLDLDRLVRDHPRVARLKLENLSIRGQRYALIKAKFLPAELKRYTQKLPWPEMRVISPGF